MSLVKRTLEEYCESVHPDDFDAQDRLFVAIMNGEVAVSLEEMRRHTKLIAEWEGITDADNQPHADPEGLSGAIDA